MRFKKFGQEIVADLKKGAVGGFDLVKGEVAEVGLGRTEIARGEIGGIEARGETQTKAGAWWGSLCAEATTEQVRLPFCVLTPVRSPGWRWVARASPWSAMSSMKG